MDDLTVDEYLNVLVAEAAYSFLQLNSAMKQFQVPRAQRRQILRYITRPIDYKFERVDGNESE